MPAPREKLTGARLGESSSVVATRVEVARERQCKRFASHDSRVVCNADMTPADVATGQSLMRTTMQQLQLSARAFHRVLKIARTIADLAGNDEIAPAHLGRGHAQDRAARLVRTQPSSGSKLQDAYGDGSDDGQESLDVAQRLNRSVRARALPLPKLLPHRLEYVPLGGCRPWFDL